jgi:diphthamide synthase (EF-2-diphthine--ammonia ligase)
MAAGYSGTSLAKKLGVKDGQRTWHWKMPESVLEEIFASGVRPEIVKAPKVGLEMAHVFVIERRELARRLGRLRGQRSRRT